MSIGFGLTAVIPCYNEVESIDPTYAEIVSTLPGTTLS